MKDKTFDKDLRATIKELNELRRRLAALIDNPDTPGIVGVIDFDFMVDFVMGVSKEEMIKTHEIEVFDEAKPYWELLEW